MARRKRRSIVRSVVILFFSLCFISVVIYYLADVLNQPDHILYPEFGIYIPSDYAMHGIDVSHYQRLINWNDVKDMQVKDVKIGFVFIKATEGMGKIDGQFRRNWLKAKEKRIPRGAYHYFVMGKSSRAQAKNFIDIVRLENGDLPPVLDIEEAGGADVNEVRNEVANWLRLVEQQYKVKPIIYTNIYFYTTYLSGAFDAYPFWIAHYLQPVRPRVNRKWSFWQHSEKGHVNGIKSTVDFNVFSGDSSDFNQLLIK